MAAACICILATVGELAVMAFILVLRFCKDTRQQDRAEARLETPGS